MQLGIPTANIPADGLSDYPDLQVGVYYGVVALDPSKFTYSAESTSTTILPAVLSIGYNPFYKNTARSVVCLDQTKNKGREKKREDQDAHTF